MRLRALIGDSALWIPPRLWTYAAQNQPNGDFSSYLPSELAMLLSWQADAQALLEALQQAGFLDGMKIHGWEERNSYHTVYAERAKKAAAARWSGEDKRKRRKEKRGEEASNASSIPTGSKARGTVEEIKFYCMSIELPESDGQWLFDKWEGAGWKNGGEGIKDWKATVRSWKLNGYMASQKNGFSPKPQAPVRPAVAYDAPPEY